MSHTAGTEVSKNPLLTPSALPYGLPDFSVIRPEHFPEAFEIAIQAHREEIDRIAEENQPVTFANTIEALEVSGQLLDRISGIFNTFTSSLNTDEIATLDEQLTPIRAQHENWVMLHQGLFGRISALHADFGNENLFDEQRYLLERTFQDFVRSGAQLPPEKRQQLSEINTRLAELYTRFDQNLLKDSEELALEVSDPDVLKGASEADLTAFRESAVENSSKHTYRIALEHPTSQQLFAKFENRELREELLQAVLSKAARQNEYDNSGTVLEIVRLRAHRAEILGFKHHADYVISDETAGSLEAVTQRLNEMIPTVIKNVSRDAEILQRTIRESGEDLQLHAHDWAYYTQQRLESEFNIDTESLKPYFEANSVLVNGVFFAAEKLYGLTFTRRNDLHSYTDDGQIYEVFLDEQPIGLFILDLYARSTKSGGAWMNTLSDYSGLLQEPPIVLNTLNVPKPAPGEPTLLSLYDVNTLFHEFGHALHALLTTVTYPSFSGTSVFRDFVEFPSQINEMWMFWPEVVENFARHYETGEVLDSGLLNRIRQSESFDAAFSTAEYLAATVIDLAWHSLSLEEAAEVTDVSTFERQALEQAGLDLPLVPPRYSSRYFSHIFAGGYSALYYSYIWSEVLDADTEQWFIEQGGLTRENGRHFAKTILSQGGSVDPLKLYQSFRGKEADVSNLLKRRGLLE